ncbi:hypothetical protein HanXRQr2_Chr13g0601461 [Helianthus annuus]|uniref:Uncharacterized protein n=1 Tax=Helianthus annuus TaxID=4232 RepID=A0A251SV85_HELAN|nr:hypothetical protein HanXRQr2_Chr13g0601461 [Helianthus annuus]KAJ0850337.1 hypothetical protein HanPSC8_Chr13g0579481 [Helianthus annuus]
MTQVRLPLSSYFLQHLGEGRIRVTSVRLGWETRFYRSFHCRAFERVEVGFPRIWESQGAGGGRVVDLGHISRCHGGWHVVHCRSKKNQLATCCTFGFGCVLGFCELYLCICGLFTVRVFKGYLVFGVPYLHPRLPVTTTAPHHLCRIPRPTTLGLSLIVFSDVPFICDRSR